MVDVISAVSGGLAIGQNVLQFLGYVRKLTGANVIAALFDPDAKLKKGDEKIQVRRHETENDERTWWYEVEDLEDYSFVRIPVVGSGIVEIVGAVQGKNPDARYWRWVSQALPGRIYGGDAPSVRVDFVVVGYRPDALVKHFSKSK
jgi:hypothetical protein